MVIRRFMIAGLAALIIMTGVSGCKLFGKNPPDATNPEAGAEEGGEAAIDSGEEAETWDETPSASEEENLFGIIETKPLINNYRPLSVKTRDGLKIIGTLYVPGIKPYNPETDEDEAGSEESEEPVKPAKVQYPLVVLFHSLSGDRWEWRDYPRHLYNAGYAVLAFDLRGHGESIYIGKRLSVWRQFGRSDWQKMHFDLENVLDSISKQPRFNMVNTRRLGLIGSSIGANVAVNFAGKHPQNVMAMVLLSPGLEYHGIETFNPLTEYENPIYFVASTEDSYATDSVKRLYKFALGKKRLQIYENMGHGTDILNNDAELGKNILDWLKTVLVPPAEGKSDSSQGEASSKDKSGKDKEGTSSSSAISEESAARTGATTDSAKSTEESSKEAKTNKKNSEEKSAKPSSSKDSDKKDGKKPQIKPDIRPKGPARASGSTSHSKPGEKPSNSAKPDATPDSNKQDGNSPPPDLPPYLSPEGKGRSPVTTPSPPTPLPPQKSTMENFEPYPPDAFRIEKSR